MKKSPLSTPGCLKGNFYRGYSRMSGHSYSQNRSNIDNHHQLSDINQTPNYRCEDDMIPLETSSPKLSHFSHGDWRQPIDKYNRRFSSTEISNSYDYNNRVRHFHSSPVTLCSLYNKNHRNQQQNHKQKNQPYWYRNIPISDFVDLRSMCENPWTELERELGSSIVENYTMSDLSDSSVQIISKRNELEDSSVESLSAESTINISSGCDNDKGTGSPVDLQLESINFSLSSKDDSILNNISSQE